MSVENFIPEVTRAEVQVAYDREKVVIATLSPIPDGEIKSGNAVKIIGADLPTVVDYKAAGRRIQGEDLDGTDVTVLIDQEKATAQRVDDIDARQAAGSLSQFTDLQGAALARDAEKYVIETMLAGATQGSTTTVTSAANAKKAARDLAAALDAAESPEGGRYLLVNPKAKALLVEGIGESAAVQAAPGTEFRRNLVGEYAGFTVIWSVHFPATVTDAAFVAYHSAAAAFADQIDKTEAVRAADGFADVVRSLNVYGAKVTRPAGVHVAGFDATPETPGG